MFPRASVRTPVTWYPAIVTLAGFVPCAVSGMTICVRVSPSPRLSKCARMTQQAGELALGARRGLEADRVEPGDLAEDPLEVPLQLERALRGVVVGERVEVAEAREPDEPLVDARVVLHRAGAERVEARVDAEVAARELGEMAQHLGLGELGKPRRGLAGERRAGSRARAGRASARPGRAGPARDFS